MNVNVQAKREDAEWRQWRVTLLTEKYRATVASKNITSFTVVVSNYIVIECFVSRHFISVYIVFSRDDPVRFMPLVFNAKATSWFATLISMFIVLQSLLPTYSQSPALVQETTLTSSCKLRSNKCMIYSRAGFVIIQVTLQHDVRRVNQLQKLSRAERRSA